MESKLKKIFEAMVGPATSKQLWALFQASKLAGQPHDYRNDNLTKQQASDLLKELIAKSNQSNNASDIADDISSEVKDENFIPATSKQLWALYLASRNAGEPHDYRGDNLSKDEATELLNQFNSKNPYKKFDFNKEVLNREEEIAIEKAATKKPRTTIKEENNNKIIGDFTSDKNQKLLKQQCIEQLKYYLEYILDNDIDEKKLMRDYDFDNADVYIPICNGQFIAIIDKEHLQTEFYHGFSCIGQGQTSSEMWQTIQNQKNNEVEHFKAENLYETNEKIEMAKSVVNDTYYNNDNWNRKKYKFAFRPRWHRLKNVNVLNIYMDTEGSHSYNNELDLDLNNTDKKNILKGYKLCKEHMEKRLDTYLKRFGTSKIHHRTYCSDD